MSRLIIVLLCLGVSGLAIFNLYFSGGSQVIVETFRTDGDSPVTGLSFLPRDGRDTPAVVVIHASYGGKEITREVGHAIATGGMRAYLIDFSEANPFQGDSENRAERWLADLRKVVDFSLQGDSETGLGLVGYLTGSEVAIKFALEDDRPWTTVVISPTYDQVNLLRPRNLLIVSGSREAQRYRSLSERLIKNAMTPPGADPQGEGSGLGSPDVLYGGHEDGSARQLVYLQGGNQLTNLFSQDSLEEMKGWLTRSFALPPSPPPNERRILWIILAQIGAIASFFPMVSLIGRNSRLRNGGGQTNPFKRIVERSRMDPAELGGLYFLGSLLAVVAANFILRWSGWFRMPVGSYLTVYFMSFSAFVILFGFRRAGLILSEIGWILARNNIRTIAIGALSGIYLIVCLALVTNYTWFNLLPTQSRIAVAGLTLLLILPYHIIDEHLHRRIQEVSPFLGALVLPLITRLFISLSLFGALWLRDFLKRTPPALEHFFPILVGVFLLIEALSIYIYFFTKDSLATGIFSAIFLAYFYSVSFSL